MSDQSGWKPLPISLKILFILLVLKLIWELTGIIGLISTTASMETKGLGILIELLNIILITLLLIFLWGRVGIAWLYGIAYLVLTAIVNLFWLVFTALLLSKPASEGAGLFGYLQSSTEQVFPEKIIYALTLFYFVHFLLSGIFLLVLFLQKEYFESKVSEEKAAAAEKVINGQKKAVE